MKKSKKDDQALKNPLMQIAQGLMGEDRGEEIWEEEPVSVEEFVEGRDYLNQKWNGRKGCRPKILDVLVNVCDPKVREAMFLLGKGSGKDYAASILHLYGIYRCLCMFNPQSYFGLAPSPIYFVNTARNDTQAKKVFFTQFRVLLVECPWFKGKHSDPGLQSVSFIKNIEAISVNSQAYGWLGFNTIQWVGDELAFFLESDSDDESESRAQECWEAAFGSCKTRFPKDYKMIGITTPRYDDDFVMKKFEELKNRPDGYAKQAATWDINPNLTIKDFEHELKRDRRRTMRDFGAVPQGVLESFWPDPEKLEEMVCDKCKDCPVFKNRKETDDIHACWDYDDCTANMYKGNGYWRDFTVPDRLNNEYYIHFDLAKSKDRIGFALAHSTGLMKVELDSYKVKEKLNEDEFRVEETRTSEDKYEEKPIIKVDAIGWVSTKSEGYDQRMLKNGEYNYTSIIDFIILELRKKGFNIVLITFDQFQSVMMSQTLEDKGFTVDLISLDRTDEIPVAAKYAILENRVEFPYSSLLMLEAKYLKYYNGKKVDHSKKTSKDVWDGFAGTIFNCERNQGLGGSFVPLGENDDD